MTRYPSFAWPWVTWMVCRAPLTVNDWAHTPATVDAITAYRIPDDKISANSAGPSATLNEDDMIIDPRLAAASSTTVASSGIQQGSNLRLFPPPLFSRQTISQAYKLARPSLHCVTLSNHACMSVASRLTAPPLSRRPSTKRRVKNANASLTKCAGKATAQHPSCSLIHKYPPSLPRLWRRVEIRRTQSCWRSCASCSRTGRFGQGCLCSISSPHWNPERSSSGSFGLKGSREAR